MYSLEIFPNLQPKPVFLKVVFLVLHWEEHPVNFSKRIVYVKIFHRDENDNTTTSCTQWL